MNSIGEALRRERLRRNLDLEQVARETKISIKLLEAIEAEDFSKLPGGVFAKSFVKQYARLLGLDEDEIAAELQRSIQPKGSEEEDAGKPAPSPLAIELPRVPNWNGVQATRSNSSLGAFVWVVVVILVCSAIYAWWQKSAQPVEMSQQAPSPGVANPAPAPPAVSQAAAPEPTGTATGQAQPPAAEPQPAPGAAAPPPTPAGGSGESLAANVQVVVQAQEPTWLSVRSDGREVYSGIVQPNEKKAWTGADQVRLVVGNAGGIAVELNGKPVPPLGPRGQVRVVQFSPGGVHIVPPKPPAPDSL